MVGLLSITTLSLVIDLLFKDIQMFDLRLLLLIFLKLVWSVVSLFTIKQEK